MTVLIIQDVLKFPIPNSGGGIWNPTKNTVSGEYWLQLVA